MKKYHYTQLRRPVTDQTRNFVIEDFPEISMIADSEMRSKVVEAWSYSLCCSDFQRITDIPPEGNPGAPVLRRGNQADHLRGVVRLAKAIAEEFETAYPEVVIDWTVLMAGAVCHDVGKPFEFDPANRQEMERGSRQTVAFRLSATRFSACTCVSPSGCPMKSRISAVGHSFEGFVYGCQRRMHDRPPG